MSLTDVQIRAMQEDVAIELVNLLVENMGLTINDAVTTLYNSKLFDRLMDKRTGMYYRSPGHTYCYLKEELSEK